jgi:hypothetical protein
MCIIKLYCILITVFGMVLFRCTTLVTIVTIIVCNFRGWE